jgi:hypothetical protein
MQTYVDNEKNNARVANNDHTGAKYSENLYGMGGLQIK